MTISVQKTEITGIKVIDNKTYTEEINYKWSTNGTIIEIRGKNGNFPVLEVEQTYISSQMKKTYDWKKYKKDKPFKEDFSRIDDTFFHFPTSILHLTIGKPEIIQTPEITLYLYDFWNKENGGPEE